MNSAIIFSLLVAAVCAAPVDEDQRAVIVSQTNDGPNADGSYNWSFESSNGISARESGGLKNPDTLAAEGSYTYTDKVTGQVISVVYTADENGFNAQGAHLPTSPPIPEAILRSLAWNAAHPEQDESQPQGNKRPVG